MRPDRALLTPLRSHVGAVGGLGSLRLLLLLLFPDLALAVGFIGVQVRGGESDCGGGTAKHADGAIGFARVVWAGLMRFQYCVA
jgi:hypothetical protein